MLSHWLLSWHPVKLWHWLISCFYTPRWLLQVGCSAEGKLLALQVDMYSNGGNSLDLSASVMDRALLHIDCVYKIPNVRALGHVCRTNHASNTAFRGFGGPQVRNDNKRWSACRNRQIAAALHSQIMQICSMWHAVMLASRDYTRQSLAPSRLSLSASYALQAMMIAETYMDHLARTLGMPPVAFRELNLYKEGESTHFGQILEGTQVRCRTCTLESYGNAMER